MPDLYSIAFPSATRTVMGLMAGIVITPTGGTPVTAMVNAKAPPPEYDFTVPLITVARVGGVPDPDDVTDRPIVQIGCYGPDFLTAENLAALVQVRCLSAPATNVVIDGGTGPADLVSIDSANIYAGESELQDQYPDERRIVSTYQFGWRRQFH